MSKAPVCPKTGKVMVRDTRPMEISYKGQSATIDMPGWYCHESGESVHTDEDMKVSDAALKELRLENLLKPPYNILKSQTTYGILYILEMALAGFSKEDIDVYVEGASSRKLVISVKSKTEENTNSQFLVRGLSFRSFVRKFDLTPNVEVQKVKLENGILKVELLDKKIEPKKQSFDIE